MNPLRRKMPIAACDAPREPNIDGRVPLVAEPALAYIDHLRRTTGERVTLTTVVGKAVALGLRATPTLNGYLSLERLVPHERVNVTFLVAFEEGRDLAKARIDDLDRKSGVEATIELRALTDKVREGRDAAFNKSMGPVRFLPTWALNRVLRAVGFLTTDLGLSLPALSPEPFPFGSCVISNVGTFGLDEGYVPPTPFVGVSPWLPIGAARDAPMAVNGKVVVRKQLTLTATIDHRSMDRAQGATLAKTVRQALENPSSFDSVGRYGKQRGTARDN